jgi:thioredoxin 1
MAGSVVNLTSSSFDETIGSSSTPVLVDFWADWCGPCKAIAPVLEQLATEQTGKLSIAKVNVDDHGDIAERFKVMSIPTLILFKDGKEVTKMVGARGKSHILDEISPHLS